MARSSERHRELIYTLAADWKGKCLLGGKSLLWPDDQVWTKEVLELFNACFTEQPDESAGSFEEKFKRQLTREGALVTKLAAELILVYFLFPSSVSGRRKRELIQDIVSWRGLELPADAENVLRPLEDGIGHPGTSYIVRRDLEVAFLAETTLKLVAMPDEERRCVLDDHVQFRNLLDQVAGDSTRPGRDILLHLLYPDYYERLSPRHKQQVAETFSEILTGTGIDVPEDMDDKIYAIRGRLEQLLPDKELDFYLDPLRQCWYVTGDSDDLTPLQGLGIKKQIVFYGPPGTGKTYEARQLANGLVRQRLFQEWGPSRYFSCPTVADVVKQRTRRVQFHPGYAYEDFIRGLQLVEGGRTEYRDGVLLGIIEQLQEDSEDYRHIPFVLILDEMNRADLSKVLGECFSLMEDRENRVQLAGQDAEPRKVSLPENLYFIGTMNLIDQSLEQVDFALRRRFLWFFRGFDRQQFLAVAESRWNLSRKESRIRKAWERHASEFETLAERAEFLNERIAQHLSLGEQYQIGHTYFCDVVSFIETELAVQPRMKFVLYNARGRGRQQTMGILWRYSIAPLLEQYLSGVDSAERKTFLDQAESLLMSGTK